MRLCRLYGQQKMPAATTWLNVRKSIRRQPKWAEMVGLEMPFGHFYVHKSLRMITGSPVGEADALGNPSRQRKRARRAPLHEQSKRSLSSSAFKNGAALRATLEKPQKAVSIPCVSTRLFVYIVAEIRGILGQGRCKREGIKRWWE